MSFSVMGKSKFTKKQGGNLILTVGLVFVMLMVGGIAVDAAFYFCVHQQMQTSADAAALAGASAFAKSNAATLAGRESDALTAARSLAQNNSNYQLNTGDVAFGFVAPGSDFNAATFSTPSNNAAYATTGGYNAVAVTVNAAQNQANGPIPSIFNAIFGMNSYNSAASSVAMLNGVSGMTGIRPLAVCAGAYNQAASQFGNPSIPLVTFSNGSYTLTAPNGAVTTINSGANSCGAMSAGNWGFLNLEGDDGPGAFPSNGDLVSQMQSGWPYPVGVNSNWGIRSGQSVGSTNSLLQPVENQSTPIALYSNTNGGLTNAMTNQMVTITGMSNFTVSSFDSQGNSMQGHFTSSACTSACGQMATTPQSLQDYSVKLAYSGTPINSGSGSGSGSGTSSPIAVAGTFEEDETMYNEKYAGVSGTSAGQWDYGIQYADDWADMINYSLPVYWETGLNYAANAIEGALTAISPNWQNMSFFTNIANVQNQDVGSFTFINHQGQILDNVAEDTFFNNLTVNGQAWSQVQSGYNYNSSPTGQWYTSSWVYYAQNYGYALPPSTILVGYINDYMATHNGTAPTLTFTDSNGQQYSLPPIFFSPVKVSLSGKDAEVNSDDQFMTALDGFKSNVADDNMIQTAGGLNADEAWLVTDRQDNGLFRGKALDGNDVFGDHLGKYKTGYEDLANLFKAELKTDANGKHYIPLRTLSGWERSSIWLGRMLGINKKWNASYDLNLLTRNDKVIPASRVLSAVYVDYTNTNEMDTDHHNWIKQRAMVQYTNGKKAKSADQWFVAALDFRKAEH